MIIIRNKKDIESIVKNIIVENLGADIEELQNDTRFKEDLGVDSLDLIELSMEFEKQFEINDKVTRRELEKIQTVGDVIDIISRAKKKF